MVFRGVYKAVIFNVMIPVLKEEAEIADINIAWKITRYWYRLFFDGEDFSDDYE